MTIKLDETKLLGFRLQAEGSDGLKMGGKGGNAIDGLKMGGKVTGPMSLKMGTKGGGVQPPAGSIA
ncbi:hypothetical protein [Vannielia litorea]|uniref:hypothetical protein n=1 Tax=Vannielia TaxID=2813041 RepID=UPI001C94F270|nr:hypothetical protein [Vannielia litorea]MBY6046189.1 hypothetical protein [Vannielia litorea]MBY6073602.1 hypothetical protein [Vannielia litorea]